jgi:arginyl-tRNA--protein-N-Asp/Glu arginylyltransferase
MIKIKNNYPHTIGYYIESSGKSKNFKANYLNIQKINNETELLTLLKFLKL